MDAFHFGRNKEAIMNLKKKILTAAFVMLFLGAGAVYEASAQRRVVTVRRPVIVTTYGYYNPYYRTRYYYDPFYDPYYYSPYLRAQEQRYYLEQRLAGNRRELNEHLRKYRADGVITAKERRELDDDYKDVRESMLQLRRYSRNY